MNPERFLRPDEIDLALARRFDPAHVRKRQDIERRHNELYSSGRAKSDILVEWILRLTGTYRKGRANAARVVLRHNEVRSQRLPPRFDGFTILHLSDLHADMSADAMAQAARVVRDLRYDLCVLTGDYRGRTAGPFQPSLENILPLRDALRGAVYGVLGNHDPLVMVPDLERLGIRMLLNEHVQIERDDHRIFLAGIDDAHYFRMDNIEAAAANIDKDGFSILLSHTLEPYRGAADAGSISCWLATRTAGKSVYPAARR